MQIINGLGIRLRDQESANRAMALADLPESELGALLHRLEGLARIEGLREEPTVLKIPTVTQQEIDNKAEDDEVLKHDGTVTLSAEWAPGQVITFPNTGLHILDTDASHDLILKAGSNLTADRTLTVTTGDSDRTLTIDENGTLTNYLLKDGSRGLTSDWDIGDGRKIQADEIAARDGAGLGLYDDGGNGLFVADGGVVGINTTNPGEGQATPISNIKLDIDGNLMLTELSTTDSDEAKLFLFRSDGAVGSQVNPASGLKIGAIEWTALTSVDNNNSVASGRIEVEASKTWSSAANRDADMIFSTVKANTLGERVRITGDNYVVIGATSGTALLDVNSDIIRLRTSKTPASAGASGNAGDICWDSSFLYICIATNTWQRVGHATW